MYFQSNTNIVGFVFSFVLKKNLNQIYFSKFELCVSRNLHRVTVRVVLINVTQC